MKKNLVNRADQREVVKKHMTQGEVYDLGIDLPAGSDHYRAFVGPPMLYDRIGALQFNLLNDLGLREYNSILEIGCGSLRLARLLIPFLLPGRYYGVEPKEELVEEGFKHHFGESRAKSQINKLKLPRFSHNPSFDFSFIDDSVDFIIAQSIASHTGVSETRNLLQNIVEKMHDDSLAMITFIRTDDISKQNNDDGWFYPECVCYTDNFMANLAKELGVFASISHWPMGNRTEYGLLTTQTPLILTKKIWKPSVAQRFAGLSIESSIRRL